MNNITLCCVAHNESARIKDFIEYHRQFVNEIVVVDTCSTDDTVSICQSLGVAVLHDKHRGLAEPTRHIAALNSSNDWILFLDADEFATQLLLNNLSQYINSNFDGYIVERHNFIDGQLIDSECNQYRLFNKKHVVFNWFLHGGIEPLAYSNIGTINDAINHIKSTKEYDIDNNSYRETILNNPESISPFWYIQYQSNVFPIECMLTMVVTTSAKHSNPSVKHIEDLFNSYNSLFGLTAIRKILVVDGFNESRNLNNLTYDKLLGPVNLNDFNSYKDNLSVLCPKIGVELMCMPEHKYSDASILEATTRISTPFYIYIPDDIKAVRQVDIANVIKEMSKDLSVKRLHFHHYELEIDEYNWQLIKGGNTNLPYLKTPSWSQNVHIGHTSHYNYCFGPTIREIGKYPLELIINKKYNDIIKSSNFDAGFRTYGCALYGNLHDNRFVDHDFSYLLESIK